MEILDAELKLTDIFYGIGAIVAGIYYGFAKYGKKLETPNELIKQTENQLIEILRKHVDEENENNKENLKEIKELKSCIDSLEETIVANKKIIRKYENYVDRLKYFCPVLPPVSETITEEIECDVNCGKILKTADRRKSNCSIEDDKRQNKGRRSTDILL